MTLRTAEWRTFALPAAVVVSAAMVLLWFQVVRVPTVERYLDEAHLRVLRTVASQIKSRIDQIDEHLELATRSVDADELGQPPFRKLVKDYTVDLEVMCAGTMASACESPVERTLWAAAKDQPVGQLLRKSGRDFLYLGYPRAAGARIIARIDIGKVFVDNLPDEREFDAVLLIDAEGRVIVQHSAEGLDLARVDGLRAGAAPSSSPDTGEPARAEAIAWRGVGTSTVVTVAGANYNFYSHPLPLSVLGLGPGAYAPGTPEQWTLAALVASDRVHAASAAVPYDVLAWVAIALLTISAAIPLLKLYLLNPHERLARHDAVWVAASIYALVALSAFLALQLYEFELALPRRLDHQLQTVSAGLLAQFQRETRQIGEQLHQFHRELRNEPSPVEATEPSQGGERGVPKIIPSADGCKPAWACRQAVLRQMSDRIAGMHYPFFDLATWLDLGGQQRVKWSTAAGVTPFINSAAQRLPYFEQLRKAKLVGSPSPQSGISVVLSPTTGKRLTVFWRTVSGEGRTDEIGGLAGQTLVVNPLTFDQPVLPSGVGFAVVDRTGKVLFHSDRTRSMKENFVQESEGNLALRSHVAQRTCGVVTVTYRAQTHRVSVQPIQLTSGAATACEPSRRAEARSIDLPAEGEITFPSPDWSLLVFQDRSVPDTLMLYTLAVGTGLFGIYSTLLVVACALLWWCFRTRMLAWLWPDRRHAAAYLWLFGLNAALAATCLWAIYWLSVPQMVMVTAGAVAAALGASVGVAAHRSKPRPARPPGDAAAAETSRASRQSRRPATRWLGAFLVARASLVLVIAGLPALAVMHTALSLERRIFVAHDTGRLARQAEARTTRLQERQAPAAVCGPAQSCAAYQTYLAKLGDFTPAALAIPPLFEEQAGPDERVPFWTNAATRWFLWIVHPPVNDLGVELLPSVRGAVPRPAPPSRWWLLASPLLLLLSWLLVRYATNRMCQPDVAADAEADGLGSVIDLAATPAPQSAPIHRLIVSPPGGEFPAALNRYGVAVDLRLRPLPPALPAGRLLILRHLEAVLVDVRARRHVLALLEAVVYDAAAAVWVCSERDPIAYVEALTTASASPRRSGLARGELDRWILLLQSFRFEVAGVRGQALPPVAAEAGVTVIDVGGSNRPPIPDPIAAEVSRCPALLPVVREVWQQLDGAVPIDVWWSRLVEVTSPYYRSLWASCSREEQLVLRQLAEEGLVNPRDRDVLVTLIRKGLVIRDPAFRLMNASFAGFVTRAVPAATIAQWERQIAGTPWSSVRTALITMTMVGAGFVAITQQHLLSAWVGLLPALAPTVVYPMLREAAGKLLAQRFSSQSSV